MYVIVICFSLCAHVIHMGCFKISPFLCHVSITNCPLPSTTRPFISVHVRRQNTQWKVHKTTWWVPSQIKWTSDLWKTVPAMLLRQPWTIPNKIQNLPQCFPQRSVSRWWIDRLDMVRSWRGRPKKDFYGTVPWVCLSECPIILIKAVLSNPARPFPSCHTATCINPNKIHCNKDAK